MKSVCHSQCSKLWAEGVNRLCADSDATQGTVKCHKPYLSQPVSLLDIYISLSHFCLGSFVFYVFVSECVCVCRRTARRQSVLNRSQRWSWLNRSLCWITSSSGASLMSQSSHETQSVLSYVICIRSNRHKSPLWALGMLLEGHK